MNPFVALMLVGGAAAAVVARTSGRMQRGPRFDCAKFSGADLFIMGRDYEILLPPNVAVDVSRKDGRMQCGGVGQYPLTLDLNWSANNVANVVRPMLEQIVIPAALSQPEIGFWLSVRKGPRYDRNISATVANAWQPGIVGEQAPGVLEEGWRNVFIVSANPAAVASRGGQLADLSGFTEAAEWFQLAVHNLLDAQNFNWNSNQVAYFQSCDPFIGHQFLPGGSTVNAMPESSLAAALAIPGNTAWGYVDYLLESVLPNAMGPAPVDEYAWAVAGRLLVETNPPCDLEDDLGWPAPIEEFYEWLFQTVRPWVADWRGGVA